MKIIIPQIFTTWGGFTFRIPPMTVTLAQAASASVANPAKNIP